jgi:dipeptidyl aminopeptidase/acylaminoacyl peptidase
VNYGGSTGYGRAFRERLREQWGVVDVEDCAFVAQQLAKEGIADPQRLGIRGGSAGGWTSAASLTSTGVYRCGMVAYPILDLAGWTSEGGETHDFESRYVEGLVGTLPQAADRYRDRSPSRKARSVSGPVLLLQGLEDEICPPEQADRFAADLAGSGIPHAYLTFEGEQHGFRKAESIKRALEAELSFYGQVFGFVPPGVPVLELRR